MRIIETILASLRSIQTRLHIVGKQRYLSYGPYLHIGKGSRIWAPDSIKIGSHVYIGKQVHIEANCEIGDYCLIANRVASIGRNDHDYKAVGFPMRYASWHQQLSLNALARANELTWEKQIERVMSLIQTAIARK